MLSCLQPSVNSYVSLIMQWPTTQSVCCETDTLLLNAIQKFSHYQLSVIHGSHLDNN